MAGQARAILLHFGGASYRAEAWVNGRFAGSHEGAYTPFYFDISALLQPAGDQELIVRVAGLSRDRAVDGQILAQAPASKQSWYYEYSGLWGEVSLEVCPVAAIEFVHIEPNLRSEYAMVEVGLMNRGSAAQAIDLQLRVIQPDGKVAADQSSPVVAPPGPGALRLSPGAAQALALASRYPAPVPSRCASSLDDRRGGRAHDGLWHAGF